MTRVAAGLQTADVTGTARHVAAKTLKTMQTEAIASNRQVSSKAGQLHWLRVLQPRFLRLPHLANDLYGNRRLYARPDLDRKARGAGHGVINS